jgi:Terpene synthase family 2, C-terminal metal binding
MQSVLAVPARDAARITAAVAAIGSELDGDRLALLTGYSHWSVLLDDRLDAPSASPAVLRAFAERVCRIARGDRSAPRVGYVGDRLVELLAGFRGYDPDGALYRRLVLALCDAIRAAVELARRRLDVRPPTLDEYLDLGARDVNYRSFGYALALLTAAPFTEGQLVALDAALVPASRAVRLANDVGSAARDRAAGRLNVLTLRRDDGSPVTEALVWRVVDDLVRRHDHRLATMATPAVTVLSRSLRVAVATYRSVPPHGGGVQQ